jgi:DNA-binding transcriptional regulator YhcF (GntR family)
MALDISIDRNSSVPLHEQIKDRVKLGLALGTLRPGDNLPSIRQMEERLHIGSAVVRRAYRELADVGILDLQHGRGVFIRNGIRQHASETVRQYEDLYNLVTRELDRVNLVPASFARFVYGRIMDAERQAPSVAIVEDSNTIAGEYAAQLSQEWQIPLGAFTLGALRSLPAVRRAELRRVITSYYHVDEVRVIMQKHRAKVLPVDIEFRPEMIEDVRALSAGSRVVFVIHGEDYAHLRPYVGSFVEDTFRGAKLHFEFVSLDKISIPDLLHGDRYARVFFSNRIWEGLDDQIRNSPLVRRPLLQITQQSVTHAWVSIGVV